MTANEKLVAKLQTQTTTQLASIVKALNMNTTTEAMIVSNRAMRILDERMTEDEIVSLCNELEAELDAA